MKITKELSLKWKIFRFLIGFCALLLLILWIFQTLLLNDMYKSIRRHEINNAIELVSKNIESPNLSQLLKELEQKNEILVFPKDEFHKPPELIPNTPNPNFEKHPPEAIVKDIEFKLKDGKTVIYVFSAIITPVGATIQTLRYQLYFITIIMIVLSVGLALIISKKIAKPIEDINKSAKELSFGNYDTLFTGTGFLEIKELSNTLNKAAFELGKVDALRKELIANISHDLRTPLSLIYSYAEIMNDFPSEITQEQTQIIMDETQRLSSLVHDILQVSKIENGIYSITKAEFNLTETIKNIIFNTQKLIENQGFIIEFNPKEEVFIIADEIKIIQAFYNLLINAINYSTDEKKVLIRQINTKSTIKIEIIDYGIGISPEDKPYIWDRYYKTIKTHNRAITGSGLGLSIVKKLIYLHNGICGVDSEKEKGSTFWFEIPKK